MASSARQTGFLEALPADAIRRLRAVGREVAIPAGRTVFGEGDDAPTLALLLRGRLKVLTQARDGTEVLIAIHRPGDLLGELSTLVGAARSASVVALEPVLLLVVPLDGFEQLLASDRDVVRALIRTLVERLRAATAMRAELVEDVPTRVVHLLLRLADEFGVDAADGGVVIDVPLTQQELAALASASRGTVAAALRDLREAGLVRTARRNLRLPDVERLRHRLA
jgi:CRP-like cAMP-binding protein